MSAKVSFLSRKCASMSHFQCEQKAAVNLSKRFPTAMPLDPCYKIWLTAQYHLVITTLKWSRFMPTCSTKA